MPGGRYLVSSWSGNISFLDLGYTSSADCKLNASVGLEGGSNFEHLLSSDHPRWFRPDNFFACSVSPPLYDHLVFCSGEFVF